MQFKAALLAVGVWAYAAASAHASPYDTTVKNAGPLAYYNLTQANGSTTTDTINGYTMNLDNGASVVPGTGPTINGAAVPSLVLANDSGGSEYAESGGSNPEIGGIDQAGTVIAWINLADLPSNQGRTFSIAGTSQVGDDVDLQINGDNTIHFYTDGGSSVASAALTSSSLGDWLFVAGSFTAGADRELYINGALVDSNTPGGHSDSNQPFYIGQSNVFGGRYFDGKIADVAFFDKDLSAAQIGAIYASASAPDTVSAAPEPSIWLLMIVGVGAVGLALRHGGSSVRRRFATQALLPA